jgi:hypothetical protein
MPRDLKPLEVIDGTRELADFVRELIRCGSLYAGKRKDGETPVEFRSPEAYGDFHVHAVIALERLAEILKG